MFRNYFLTAWRNLIRNRWYSTVNILGLAIGMSIALLIGLWVQYQYSFDRWLPGYQQIAQVHTRFIRNGEISQAMGTPLPLSEALRKEVPGIRYVAHTDWMGMHGLTAGNHKVYMEGAQAEEDFFKVFPLSAIKGDADKAIRSPYTIVLTESVSRSLFGTADPMGKKVRVDNQQDFIVGAVLADLPPNATFKFSYVLPFSYDIQANGWVKEATTNWNNNSFQTFVALAPGTTAPQVEASLLKVIKKYDPEAVQSSHESFFLHPMKDWHLYSEFKNGHEDGGFIEYVRLFSLIGVLVLLIACVNFMNLSTARSERRAREVGVRKAIGSLRSDLIIQFLLESMLITGISALMALALVQIALPSFNLLTSCTIVIPWRSTVFWGVMVFYITATGLLAGSRPAFYLSSFSPVKVLKGTIRIGKAAAIPRKLLVVLQFTCSIALIISAGLIYHQIQFAKDRPMAYDASHLVFSDGSPEFAPAEPVLFTYDPNEARNILYRLSPTADPRTAMARLAPVFNTYNPAYPFTYHFVDESYAEKFQLELLVGRLAGIFFIPGFKNMSTGSRSVRASFFRRALVRLR